MGWFKKDDPLGNVQKLSIFPRIGSVVLKIGKKLVVFSPSYLLGKHGSDSQQVSSKFLDLNTATKLLEQLGRHISEHKLKGNRVEIKEINVYMDCGTDAMVVLNHELRNVVAQEDIRGSKVNVIYTEKRKIPKTSLMNFILVKFDPKFGQGVEQLFKKKYGDYIGFESFDDVYAVLTMFPGKYAPSFDDTSFWRKHALLKER